MSGGLESELQCTSLVPTAAPRVRSSTALVRRGLDGLVALASSQERWEMRGTLAGHNAPVIALFALRDGNTLLSADSGGAVLHWCLDRYALLRRVTEVGPTRAFAVSHDARLLAVARAAGGITLLEFATGARLGQLDAAHVSWLDAATESTDASRRSRYRVANSLAFSAREDSLFAAYGAERILEWDCSARRLVGWLDADGEPPLNVYAITATPDGRSIIGGDGAGRIGSWSAGIGKLQWMASGHAWPVLHLVAAPDGSHIVSVAGDGSACIWSAGNGAPLGTAGSTGAGVTAVGFAPDSSHLVVAGCDGTVAIRASAAWRELGRWNAQPSKITTVAITDRRAICTAGEDHRIRIWERAA